MTSFAIPVTSSLTDPTDKSGLVRIGQDCQEKSGLVRMIKDKSGRQFGIGQPRSGGVRGGQDRS